MKTTILTGAMMITLTLTLAPSVYGIPQNPKGVGNLNCLATGACGQPGQVLVSPVMENKTPDNVVPPPNQNNDVPNPAQNPVIRTSVPEALTN